MARLAETEKYPWDEEKILSRDHRELADYLKTVIKRSNDIYSKISNAVNLNILNDVTGLPGLLANDQHVLDAEVLAVAAALIHTHDIGEGHITILPWHYSGITQGTWVQILDANQIFYGYFWNSSNTQNDRIDYKVFLAAGTYTFSIIGVTASNRAILTLLFDGASQGTIDLYAAGTAYNVLKTITDIVVGTAGLKTISLKAATRHASSTGWYLSVSSMALFRTA